MRHFTLPIFWRYFRDLPPEIQRLALKNYRLLQQDPFHPSLHFKPINSRWSVRVGLDYRALALQKPEGMVWFWIGSHQDYDKILKC